jgi:RimJ/RimL family protein N-acetyltransferase
MSLPLPERIDLGDGLHLRQLTPDDAGALARSVGESLEHLKPWMPWAGRESADETFQRERLMKLRLAAVRDEEWNFGLFDGDDPAVLGCFGLMTRRGPGTIEIGYWVHVDATGNGHATKATRALTEVGVTLPGIRRVLIYCDKANTQSAAIPERLGYTLIKTEKRAPDAPAESGVMLIWARQRSAHDANTCDAGASTAAKSAAERRE